MRSATCLQTLHILISFALKAARKALFLCVINSSMSRKPKYLLRSITMSLELVLKIFITTLVTVNSILHVITSCAASWLTVDAWDARGNWMDGPISCRHSAPTDSFMIFSCFENKPCSPVLHIRAMNERHVQRLCLSFYRYRFFSANKRSYAWNAILYLIDWFIIYSLKHVVKQHK